MVEQLKAVSMFGRLSQKALEEIAALVQTRRLVPGEVLFHQGDAGDEMFIVGEGSLALFLPNPEEEGKERPIRIFAPGDALGEMALIDRQPRSASARALEPALLLVLAGDDFRRLLRQYPDMALGVMSGLNERVRYTTDFLVEVREWVKRVAEGDYQRGFQPGTDYRDRSIATLAAEFAQMAAQVRRREEALRREIEQLRIEIDEAKKQRQVEEIVESDYFQSLRAQARRLRQQGASKESEPG